MVDTINVNIIGILKRKTLLKDIRECSYKELSFKTLGWINGHYVVKVILLPGEG